MWRLPLGVGQLLVEHRIGLTARFTLGTKVTLPSLHAGDGGMRASGRWHTRGRRIVYYSECPAAALLEILVHFEIDVRDLPAKYRLLKLHAPDDLIIEHMNVADLPADWTERTDITRAVGDRWLQAATSPLRRVPSAVVPETSSVLLNSVHPDARRVGVAQVSEHPLDPRLLK